jgi:peptide/nickel transport system permease protein
MLRFVLLRLLRAFLTILAVVTFAFVVLNLSGDPATVILSPDAPPEAIAAFRKAWGLDQPLWLQYLHYCANVAHGDFGSSMRGGRPALDLVVERIPATLALTIPALLLKLIVGIPAGIFAALHRNTVVDRATVLVAVAGYTSPNYVLGFALVLVFAVSLRWLPSGGFDGLQSLVLPVITLGAAGAAVLARFTRSAMVEVLGQPYIRAAQAKGLPWRQVVVRHALPNAAIPTVTIVGLMIGSLVAGAIIVESVFSWPGVGRLLVLSVANRDLAVVQTILILVAASMVVANFAVDMTYGWLDPRIRVRAAPKA